MAKLVKGSELNYRAQKAVLASYTYRLTVENGYPARNPCGATVASVTDAEWLEQHAFYVNKDGSLTANRRHCEPAYMIGES